MRGGPQGIAAKARHREQDVAVSALSDAAETSGVRRRSLIRYAPAVVLLAAVFADGVQYADTDVWMHVRFGQFVLHTGHLLRHDIFSYSAPGAPWFNHEWLADVLIAGCYDLAGVIGLKLLKFTCALALMVLLADGIAETAARYSVQVAVLLLVGLALRIQVQFRPQLFDYIFLAALLALLNRDARGRPARLWLAIPIMALWANLHGGFFTGIAVLGFYAVVAGAQDWVAGRGLRRGLWVAAVAMLALLETLLNPFGIHAWLIAMAKFKEPIIAMNLNSEFQTLPFHLATGGMPIFIGYLFALLVAAAGILAVVAAPGLDDLPLVAIAAMMTCGWIYAVRNMAFAVIAWCAPLAHHLDLAVGRWSSRRSPKMSAPPAMASMRLQLPILAAAIVFALGAHMLSGRLPTSRESPVGAIAFMDRHHLHGNILAKYTWGGYVVWHEVPPSRVFFDSFDERFPENVQRSYADLLIGDKEQVAAMLNRYPHDFVLIPTSWWQSGFLSGRSDWTLLYRDPVASLFARSNSAAAKLDGIPELHGTAPSSFFP
jgi:hypothetical protein